MQCLFVKEATKKGVFVIKKLLYTSLVLCAILIMLSGCTIRSVTHQSQEQIEHFDSTNKTTEKASDNYIPVDDVRKFIVNDSLRGYYYTLTLSDGVTAEYSFNDGVVSCSTFIKGQQLGNTTTGYYEIYEGAIICNFGGDDVVIEYEFKNGEIELTYKK